MAIDSERLRLRPVSHADADRLLELDADPEVMRFVSGGEPSTRSSVEDWVIPRSEAQFRTHGTGLWTLTARRGGEFIGWAQLRVPRHTGIRELELSYRLHRRFWGGGLAAEAATALIAVSFLTSDTDRIFASTHTDHAASQRVMSKLGMRLSAGSLSSEQLSPGLPDGDVEYEILREQWLRTRGRHSGITAAGSHDESNRTA
ncbi:MULTISPECIES: GNAT family N-acetyltransferase [Gordonia]|jgi:RimJ/RimL family protein N-acetyltransferase|uniref:Putative acetyltransferase n=1 Tax=Gordonia malaquae NBRC 108250 TaxID=1223542 RepID=M3VDI3_GORML|nr:GNAT family N-acetyltransferase [Gordonia malaquae]GAC78489.1 putative acetyltransferase [Gordonia malaquae NBRC 108250]SED40950.1 Protein N-acetyltransferase, RimJ/RimL family [Gordonia malaquae]